MRPLDNDQKKVLRHGRLAVEGPPGSGKSNTVEGYTRWNDKPCLVIVRKRKEAENLVNREVCAYTLQKHRYDALGKPEILCQEDLDLLLVGLQEYEKHYPVIVIDEGHNLSAEFWAVIEDIWTGEDMVVFHDKHQCLMRFAGAVDDIGDELNWRFGITETIPLTVNYRSTPKIVKVLNTIVPRDMHAYDDDDDGSHFRIERCASAEDELAFLCNQLRNGHDDVQILARNSNRCKQVSAFLKEHDVLHKLYLAGGEEVVSNGVIVQTIHTAQASEHQTVFLTGVCQGVLPDWRGGKDEHNAFYVGCSRAMRNLFISYYDTPSVFITRELRKLSGK